MSNQERFSLYTSVPHMKTINSISKALINIGLLFGAGFGNAVLAHSQGGSLSSKVGIADYYQVSCLAGTATLEAQLKNISASSPSLTVVVQRDGQKASSMSGGLSSSPWISLDGGVGEYSVNVVKADAGAATYSLEFHCKNGITHTETDIVVVQNDAPMPSDGTPPPTTNANNQALLTSIRGEGVEGSTLDAAIITADGCHQPGSTQVIPIVAQSVLFPTDNPMVTRSDTSTSIALDTVINNASLANLPQLIQNKSVFLSQSAKIDSNGNVIGFVNTKGQLNTRLEGVRPFRMGGIQFKADSCAKSLQIKIAVADICKTKVFPPMPGTANLWIPRTTTLFNNASVDGVGYAPTMSIGRDLVANPFLDSANCGEGFDVIVEPSQVDIDSNLPIPKLWTK